MPIQETWLLRAKNKSLDIEGIKRIPIATIAADHGVRLRGFGSTNCPFPDHADKNPSFQLRVKANTWKCYGCGRGGSAIDLVMELNGWNFLEASKWLQDKYIRGFSGRQKSIVQSIPKALPSEPRAYFSDVPIYDWLLSNSPLQEAGQRYLLRRHLTERTLEKFRVGQIGDARKLLASARELFGVERLYKSGLISKYRDNSYTGHCGAELITSQIIELPVRNLWEHQQGKSVPTSFPAGFEPPFKGLPAGYKTSSSSIVRPVPV